jgi:hypothetical protein
MCVLLREVAGERGVVGGCLWEGDFGAEEGEQAYALFFCLVEVEVDEWD